MSFPFGLLMILIVSLISVLDFFFELKDRVN